MYATSVGLIIRGFEHLETYKKSFNAGTKDDYVRIRKPVAEKVENIVTEEPDDEPEMVQDEGRPPLTERIKQMISKMFEVEDQKIN
jgi:hypothetical protein